MLDVEKIFLNIFIFLSDRLKFLINILTSNSNFGASVITDLIFNLVNRCQEKEARFAQNYDMGIAEFRCLCHLYQNLDQPVKQFADYMNLTSSRLMRIIDKLVEKNLIVSR